MHDEDMVIPALRNQNKIQNFATPQKSNFKK